MPLKTGATFAGGNGSSKSTVPPHADGTDHADTLGPALMPWLERLAAGDLTARGPIIEIVGGRLRTLARRMLARFPNVRRWEETDDVFQNAALRLHRSLGQLPISEPRSVMAVAATELHRELLDLARKHAGPMSYAANHGTNVVAHGDRAERHVDQAADRDESLDRWSAFHAAIDTLAPEHREVFQMVWYLGCDQKTIAAALGCCERTVKSRWRAAREAVRHRLDGDPPG